MTTEISCIPRPGESCANLAEYYVWFENCNGLYTYMCPEHAGIAVRDGVFGYRVEQISRIELTGIPIINNDN